MATSYEARSHSVLFLYGDLGLSLLTLVELSDETISVVFPQRLLDIYAGRRLPHSRRFARVALPSYIPVRFSKLIAGVIVGAQEESNAVL